MQSSSSQTARKLFSNDQNLTPTPSHLRSLVLDYLCHNCYTATAKAFARDSTIRHLDADGDEIMQPENILSDLDTPTELSDDEIRQVELREEIRIAILSGRVDDATALLNEHFPSVLSESPETATTAMPTSTTAATMNDITPTLSVGKVQPRASNLWQYVAPTSVDPSHLSLNLRVSSFIEDCRTIPLPYTPPKLVSSPSSQMPSLPQSQSPTTLGDQDDPEAISRHQTELIAKAQKLHAALNMLRKSDEHARFAQEFRNAFSLLAYKVPEESPAALYLSQERREAVADQINKAILHRIGRPAVSNLELYVRYTTTLWDLLHERRVKPPPLSTRPPGAKLPPVVGGKSGSSSSSKNAEEVLPPFDLRVFLDSKT